MPTDSPGTERIMFELQISAHVCSMERAPGIPSYPPPSTAETVDVYVYADHLQDAYAGLCTGSAAGSS